MDTKDKQQSAPAVRDEREAWMPYLSDCADGVKGHYAIARWNPAGYREVWNLHSHRWASASEDVLTLDQARELMRNLTIPTAAAPGEWERLLTQVIPYRLKLIERGECVDASVEAIRECVARLLASAPAQPTVPEQNYGSIVVCGRCFHQNWIAAAAPVAQKGEKHE